MGEESETVKIFLFCSIVTMVLIKMGFIFLLYHLIEGIEKN